MISETPFSVHHGALLDPPSTEIWVRKTDDPKLLAKDIKSDITKYQYVDLACIGAATVNQAMKAVAIVREHMRRVVAVPYFSMVTDENGNEKTRLMLRVTECQESVQK